MPWVLPAAVLVLLVGPEESGLPEAHNPTAHDIAVSAAVAILPDPLGSFFESNQAELTEYAGGARRTADSKHGPRDRAEWHYLMLDVGAVGTDWAARHAAAREFPIHRAAARTLFEQHGITAGGKLPWVLKDHHHDLVRAFERGDEQAVLREAGVTLGLAVDAALPFNSTADQDGVQEGHLKWEASGASPEAGRHRTPRQRLQGELLRRFKMRLEYEVRVWPARIGRIDRPTEAAFEVLRESHACLADLLAIDAESVARAGATDAHSFLAASNCYYDRLGKFALPIMESRLEAAALLGAGLVRSAWEAANRPDWPPRQVEPQAESAQPAPSPAVQYIGSRNSLVVHRAGCPHVARIKPENRIVFRTFAEASAAGRIPCKVCKPDAPEPPDKP